MFGSTGQEFIPVPIQAPWWVHEIRKLELLEKLEAHREEKEVQSQRDVLAEFGF